MYMFICMYIYRKEEINFPLFSDEVIVFRENSKCSTTTTNFLTLTTEYYEGHRVDTRLTCKS